MGRTKEDATVIAIILTQLPDEYSTIRASARSLARRGELELEDLMADIRRFYWSDLAEQKIYEFGANDEKDKKKEEKALTATTNTKKERT